MLGKRWRGRGFPETAAADPKLMWERTGGVSGIFFWEAGASAVGVKEEEDGSALVRYTGKGKS